MTSLPLVTAVTILESPATASCPSHRPRRSASHLSLQRPAVLVSRRPRGWPVSSSALATSERLHHRRVDLPRRSTRRYRCRHLRRLRRHLPLPPHLRPSWVYEPTPLARTSSSLYPCLWPYFCPSTSCGWQLPKSGTY